MINRAIRNANRRTMFPSNKGKMKQNKLWALVYFLLTLSTIEGLNS